MIQQIRMLLKTRVTARNDLDFLFASLEKIETLPEQMEWLVHLLTWIRYEGMLSSVMEKQTGRIPSARIRFLLMVLDRHPEWKKNLAKLLRKIVRHIGAMEFFTETGMAKEYGFVGEVVDRFTQKILPQAPLDKDLATLFVAMFPDQRDPLWVESIDAATFARIVELFYFEVGADEAGWNRLILDIEDAMSYLVIQSRAIGLSPKILRRLGQENYRESPFYHLSDSLAEFFRGYHSGDRFQFAEKASLFRQTVQHCQKEVAGVHKHLEEFGVSINIVFHLARLEAYLKRMLSLANCFNLEKVEHHHIIHFLSTLIQDNQEVRSIRSFVSQNISLLARKVAERSAETGEHYITRTRREYRRMLQGAAGGGMITALTVYIKNFILMLHAPGFVQGALASGNYAVSFVTIHLCGFTLGTKQPAMTGPALAAKMREAKSEKGLQELVDEIVHLIRSQVASIFGNVFAVVPTVILMDTLAFFVFGRHLMSVHSAHHAFDAVDILGPVAFYAAFTGILLWLSSLAAGWADNWFALRGLRKGLTYNPRLRMAFGKLGARRIATFFEKNMSGLTGNIVLGILLGMVPEVITFLGIPLEVRHVTLSSGTLGAAIPVLGWDIFSNAFFWRAIAGIFVTGVLNVSVSFSMAVWVAARATDVPWVQKKAIFHAVLSRFWTHWLTFFFPVGAIVRKAEASAKVHTG